MVLKNMKPNQNKIKGIYRNNDMITFMSANGFYREAEYQHLFVGRIQIWRRSGEYFKASKLYFIQNFCDDCQQN